MMDVQPCWQTCPFAGTDPAVKRPVAFTQPLMQAVQRLAHALPRQRVHVIGLGLLEKLGDVGSLG